MDRDISGDPDKRPAMLEVVAAAILGSVSDCDGDVWAANVVGRALGWTGVCNRGAALCAE
jgi:hypothetical protein